MRRSMRQPSRTSTDTSPMEEWLKQLPLTRSKPSNSGKVMGHKPKGSNGKTCSKCGTSHLPRECPTWGRKCHKCGNKKSFQYMLKVKAERPLGQQQELPHGRSKFRGRKGKRKPSRSRSKSVSTTHDAHSIESSSFHDHPDDPHGDLEENLHGDNSFQDHQESTDFVKKTFHTIYRLKSVASISNDMDPLGKTKILTILHVKLPHHNGIDDMRVKVNDGAEANILPLNSFRTMFLHALDDRGYPKAGFLRGSRTTLECYNDRKLINYGSVKLRLQHYSDKSFQDHYFYLTETKMPKEITVGHPVSVRLGLM